MQRRIHVPMLSASLLELPPDQGHHLRDVLRVKLGASVELFDDAGRVGQGIITQCDPKTVVVRVESVSHATQAGTIIVASAVPKGDRADWMIEKLSELGVARFIPLKTQRSVVHPTGSSKHDRWRRIAAESAKQSHRTGVMQIEELTNLRTLLVRRQPGIYFSTEPGAPSLLSHSSFIRPPSSLFLLIGPEGGWTADELSRFAAAALVPAKLTGTVLRIETAAVAAAAIVMALRSEHE